MPPTPQKVPGIKQMMKTRSKGRLYSRSGCASCKQRHIKCDEAVPACLACVKRNSNCPGYQKAVKWSDKYERWDITDQEPQEGSENFWATFTQEAANLQALITSEVPLSTPSIALSTLSDDHLDTASPNRTASTTEVYNTGLLSHSVLDTDSSDYTLTIVDPASRLISSLFCIDEGISSPVDPLYSGDQDGESEDGSNNIIPDQYIHRRLLLGNQPTTLSSYYFSLVCVITSGFDSPNNPFRSLVADLMPTYPQIFHSVHAMSAAHLYQQDRDMTAVALAHRTEAISTLALGIQNLANKKPVGDSYRKLSVAILLATCLLGLSAAWNDASSNETTFIQGARSILQHWIVEDGRSQPLPPQAIISLSFTSQDMNFFVGIVAYWESITAFQMDQALSATDYLLPLCDSFESSGGRPNPLSGITPKLFIYMAKIGSIVRKKSLTRPALADHAQPPNMTLFESARQMQQTVLNYKMPPTHKFEETHDQLTPLSHFEIIGRVYQLAVLLELYRGFPELTDLEHQCPNHSSFEPGTESISSGRLRTSQTLISLAINILALLSQLPDTSRTISIQLLPLIIAGSTLQYSQQRNSQAILSEGLIIHHGITSLLANEAVISHWRSFVSSRLMTMYRYVGLKSMQRGITIVEKVWERADERRQSIQEDDCPDDKSMVCWIKIMYEEKLETLLG